MATVERRGKTVRVVWWVEGHRQQKTFPTIEAAKAYAVIVEADKVRGTYVDPAGGRQTVAEWSVAFMESLQVRESTRVTYANLMRSRVLPKWGDRSLLSVKPIEVQAWVGELLCVVSWHRATEAYRLFHQMMKAAANNDLIGKDPCRGVTLPKRPESRVTVLTPEQIVSLADECGRYRDLVLFLGFVGVRWGEAIALTPADFRADTVTISKAVNMVKGHLSLGPTKSGKSRDVAVPSFLRHLGEGYGMETGQELVFPNTRGNWINASNWRKRPWNKALSTLGVQARIHDLRHSACSILIAQGVHFKVIQEHMGHSDIQTTLNIYGHLLPDASSTVANYLDNVYEEAVAVNASD